ncbi:MAG TPA: hypothetical protein PK151_05340 [Caldisericia bacterium]|nr:hypothetical protein [Caldisericia bacterium]
MKELFDEIKKETNLNVYPLTTVSRRIPDYHSRLIIEYQNHLEKYTKSLAKLEKVNVQNHLRNVMGETDINLMSIFKTKEEKENVLRYHYPEVDALALEVSLIKNDIQLIEKMIDFLKMLQNNIRSIIDYEKFRGGE